MLLKLLVGFLLLFVIDDSLNAQHLELGNSVPDLTVVTVNGDTLLLRAIEGKVLLNFLSCAGSMVCNYRIHEISNELRQLKLEGYTVIVVFGSDKEQHQEYASILPGAIHLVSDLGFELHKRYGIKRNRSKFFKRVFNKEVRRNTLEAKEFFGEHGAMHRENGSSRLPAEFVIEAGIVRLAHYGSNIGDHAPMWRIHQF